MSQRTVSIRLMNLTGLSDALAELEVGFLHQMLPLFQISEGVPRADVEVVRIGTRRRFLDYLFFGDVDLLHLASHGTSDAMQVGDAEVIAPDDVTAHAQANELAIGATVLTTSCEMGGSDWAEAFLAAGAGSYIAPKSAVYAKDAALFSAAFYSAFFGTIHAGKTTVQRSFDAYRMAHAAYRSFASAGGAAKFYFYAHEPRHGRVHLPRIELD